MAIYKEKLEATATVTNLMIQLAAPGVAAKSNNEGPSHSVNLQFAALMEV